MKTKSLVHRMIYLMTLLLMVFSAGCASTQTLLPYRSLPPFEGKVIDADTKQPIEGAVVLAVYYASWTSIAGSHSYVDDGQETLTDANGEFKLPRIRRWSASTRGFRRGKLVIFKPGYGLFPKHKRSEAIGVNKSWPPPVKYVVYELPILRTKNERRLNRPGKFSFSKISYEKQKMFIEEINEERQYLGLSPISPPKKGH